MLLQPLNVLLAGPALPQALSDLEEQSLVESLVADFLKAIRITEQKREAPDRWRDLKVRVDKAAVVVLQSHLPNLTHGRLLTPLIALDDPAQEMDQSTYRRFVRFLQAFVRLHRSMKLPLTLMVFLHQDDRALELARAIHPDGQLTLLPWSPQMRLSGPDANARSIRLRNPEQRAPLPSPLLQQKPAVAGSTTSTQT